MQFTCFNVLVIHRNCETYTSFGLNTIYDILIYILWLYSDTDMQCVWSSMFKSEGRILYIDKFLGEQRVQLCYRKSVLYAADSELQSFALYIQIEFAVFRAE